ncbi:probable Vacuolar protein sorting-associated protein 62 [Zygosaccharomyces bailii]|nr:probable Vacuolar protein sorting-associated protein 62 [Zygosaccharomyces bailii]
MQSMMHQLPMHLLLNYLLSFAHLCAAVFVPWADDDPFVGLDSPVVDTVLPPLLPPNKVDDSNRSLRPKDQIPDYVVDNCPLVHLYSEEKYWPSDIAEYVTHFSLRDSDGVSVVPSVNPPQRPLSPSDLRSSYKYTMANGTLANISSTNTFMTSLDDFDKDPKWLLGFRPEYGTGHIKDGPAVLVVVDKGNGWVDAFWFYFYPFNLGPFIMGNGPWGNHVGDWEHSLVRFYRGEPMYIWMSAHGGGSAYKFEAVEKVKKLRRRNGKLTPQIVERPLLFSARGTHANYASVGQHAHDVPFFFMPLSDFTDRGPMWDPSLNFYGYTFDGQQVLPAGDREREIGVSWLYFSGHWGDKQLPWNDPRQKWCPAQWKYINGPTGPLRKNLGRISLCPHFVWWNFWKGCPARRLIKKGEGLDAEKNDLMGDNCGILLYKVRPSWLRSLLRLLTWRGILCFVMDYFTG